MNVKKQIEMIWFLVWSEVVGEPSLPVMESVLTPEDDMTTFSRVQCRTAGQVSWCLLSRPLTALLSSAAPQLTVPSLHTNELVLNQFSTSSTLTLEKNIYAQPMPLSSFLINFLTNIRSVP